MNNDIKQVFLNSMVARASYVNLEKGSQTIAADLIAAENMTSSMATYFATNFSVVDSALSSGDIDSGFEAILFKHTDSNTLYV